MRNDVSIPPDSSDAEENLVFCEKPIKPISSTPIPPAPGSLVADVELHDRPNMEPTGAGNFSGLAIIGLIFAGVAVIMLWVFSGYMKR